MPRFGDDNLDRNLVAVKRLETLATKLGVTAGQLALAWLQHRGNDVVPIPGTKRRHYLEENVAATSIELSDANLAAIEEAIPVSAVAGARNSAAVMRLANH